MKHISSIILLITMSTYIFTPVGIQAQSISNTKSLTYFYSGSDLLNAQDNNGLMSSYLGKNVRTIINTRSQSIVQTNSLISDGKNIIAQTDDTGTNINNTQQYTPYGASTSFSSLKTLKHQPSTTNYQPLSIGNNPYQYNSYYCDQESGLNYLQARYYNPTLMHFISMDTYDLANRYAYCNANPIGNMDPTGHNAIGGFLNQFTDKNFWKDIGGGMIPFYGVKNDIQDLEEGNYAAGVFGLIGDTWSTYTSLQLVGGALIGLKMLFTKSIKNEGKKELEDSIEKMAFEKKIDAIYKHVISNTTYSRSANEIYYSKYITPERNMVYSQDKGEIDEAFENFKGDLEKGTPLHEAAYNNKYGDCDTQSALVTKEASKFGLSSKICFRSKIMTIDGKKGELTHAFAKVIDGDNEAIVDTWAGTILYKHNNISKYKEYWQGNMSKANYFHYAKFYINHSFEWNDED